MMDSYEPTRALFSRIQNMDPENASKIMGYILIQDQGEKEMLRLAYGPESLILAVTNRAKSDLGILSSASSAPATSNSSPSPFSPISNAISISRPNPLALPLASPRLASNGFKPSSPSSPSVWPISGSNNHHPISPNTNSSLSYAAVVNGINGTTNGSFSSSISSPQLAFGSSNRDNFVDDYHLQEQNLSFLSDPLEVQSKNADFVNQSFDLARSPSCRSDSVLYPYWDNSNSVENSSHFHRRSCSVNDVCFGTDDSTSGFGYKPCLYFSRGFCKNGSSCKFIHGGGFADSGDNSTATVGSPCKFDAFEQCQQDLMRSKVAQQQILAAQFMSGVNLPYNKLNFLQSEAQRSAAASLMMGEEFHKLNRCRVGRNDFSGMGGGDTNPGSRQIYLTFPADSTFREEDVSNYFSFYGPVQDVRIPYQQKRMFGFVTFLYSETVKLILAKGNPHFVCDSRVLVKPYKEKGKLPDKKQQQQQQLERGEFSSCSSPSGVDCREPFDLQIGGRMLYNTQEMLWRNKQEKQGDLQQALDLQGRRLMNLQLMDLKNHQQQQHLYNMSVGSSIPSPNHKIPHPSNGLCQDQSEERKDSPTEATDGQLLEQVSTAAVDSNGNVNCRSREDNSNPEEFDLPESLEHILPENLFYSPTKSAGEPLSIFSPIPSELDGGNISASSKSNNDPLMPPASALTMAPLKSCFLEMPRFSSGHGAIRM